MSPEYLAGFFDGEGCIDTQRMYPKGREGQLYVRPRVRLAVAASASTILVHLCDRFGGHLAERTASGRAQQDSVSWELLNKDAMVSTLTVMEPHLVLKKHQARLALWWLEHATGRYSGRGVGANVPAARQFFADELKAMKRDPHRDSLCAIQQLEVLLE